MSYLVNNGGDGNNNHRKDTKYLRPSSPCLTEPSSPFGLPFSKRKVLTNCNDVKTNEKEHAGMHQPIEAISGEKKKKKKKENANGKRASKGHTTTATTASGHDQNIRVDKPKSPSKRKSRKTNVTKREHQKNKRKKNNVLDSPKGNEKMRHSHHYDHEKHKEDPDKKKRESQQTTTISGTSPRHRDQIRTQILHFESGSVYTSDEDDEDLHPGAIHINASRTITATINENNDIEEALDGDDDNTNMSSPERINSALLIQAELAPDINEAIEIAVLQEREQMQEEETRNIVAATAVEVEPKTKTRMIWCLVGVSLLIVSLALVLSLSLTLSGEDSPPVAETSNLGATSTTEDPLDEVLNSNTPTTLPPTIASTAAQTYRAGGCNNLLESDDCGKFYGWPVFAGLEFNLNNCKLTDRSWVMINCDSMQISACEGLSHLTHFTDYDGHCNNDFRLFYSTHMLSNNFQSRTLTISDSDSCSGVHNWEFYDFNDNFEIGFTDLRLVCKDDVHQILLGKTTEASLTYWLYYKTIANARYPHVDPGDTDWVPMHPVPVYNPMGSSCEALFPLIRSLLEGLKEDDSFYENLPSACHYQPV